MSPDSTTSYCDVESCPGLLSREPAAGRVVGRQPLAAAPSGTSCPGCSQPVIELIEAVELDHCGPTDQHTSYRQSVLWGFLSAWLRLRAALWSRLRLSSSSLPSFSPFPDVRPTYQYESSLPPLLLPIPFILPDIRFLKDLN